MSQWKGLESHIPGSRVGVAVGDSPLTMGPSEGLRIMCVMWGHGCDLELRVEG